MLQTSIVAALLLGAAVGCPAPARGADVEARDQAHAALRGRIDALADTPEGDLSPQGWALAAIELRRGLEGVEGDDLLRLSVLVEIGYAAEHAGVPTPPLYVAVQGKPVNVAWYEAAKLAREHPEALAAARVERPGRTAPVERYLERIVRGDLSL